MSQNQRKRFSDTDSKVTTAKDYKMKKKNRTNKNYKPKDASKKFVVFLTVSQTKS